MDLGRATMIAGESMREPFHHQEQQAEPLVRGIRKIELLAVERPPLERLAPALVLEERQPALHELLLVTAPVEQVRQRDAVERDRGVERQRALELCDRGVAALVD